MKIAEKIINLAINEGFSDAYADANARCKKVERSRYTGEATFIATFTFEDESRLLVTREMQLKDDEETEND